MNDGADTRSYTVLARKYRPQTFAELIGQEVLVDVMTVAFERERVPHAIMLTGVRGVGKTTTARIIAKGLNCSSVDKPTIAPCGVCDNCKAIAESRHVDVLEMDAASRTGIDDIREIVDSVRYRAAQARSKVYIIDEVHMLSKNAFNGLLKTLEEPPPHVKFILATTDIHKVPVTVLSRCMRFDLRRVDAETLIAHLGRLCSAEGVAAEPEALGAIARVSEGSVRDSLSLLDQAISHGAGEVTATAVREMLGLAERGRLFALFEHVMTGETASALGEFDRMYVDGGDPLSLIRELADVCHLVAMVKADAARAEDPTLPPSERETARRLGEALPMRALTRAWQLLLKGIAEVSGAPSAASAAQMVIIRLSHVADLPSPEELLRRLTPGSEAEAAAPGPRAAGASPAPATPQMRAIAASAVPEVSPPDASAAQTSAPDVSTRDASPRAALAVAPAVGPAPVDVPRPVPQPVGETGPESFEALVALLRSKRDKLLFDVERFVRPGPIGAGRFEFTPTEAAPPRLAAQLAERLTQWTGVRWLVGMSDGHQAPTLAELRRAAEADLRAAALANPVVRAALDAFPGAELASVKDFTASAEAAEGAPDPDDPDAALFEEDDEDDGFDDADAAAFFARAEPERGFEA